MLARRKVLPRLVLPRPVLARKVLPRLMLARRVLARRVLAKSAGQAGAGEESAGKKAVGKKAAGKAKAGAKPKPKSQPASKTQTKDKDTFAEKARKWKLPEKQGASGEGRCSDAESEGKENAPKRELAKARKFKRMSDQQAIPQHIQKAIDKAKSRAEKTELKGHIVMKPDKSVFHSMKTANHEKIGKDQTIGMPYRSPASPRFS